ncbi:SusC/RagA family TonB-linked outer membrane protein [Phnomibacter sp. MR]|uniref:SusC/RagA family TonB-linked outer membrane protein n=1 Tax=Phnomibacter sp. MR TaxID=3042318 RepID=UPI003A80DB1D
MKRTIAPLLLGLIAGLLCMSVPAFAQNKTVSGKVTDAQGGAGLSGVSIIVKGSKTGTSTDGSGAYSLSVPNGATLVFSSVGFQNEEVAVGDRTTVDVVMTAMAGSNLNEVVVVGYGTVRKRDLTSAVTSVKAKDFNQGVMAAPDQLIQGKVAGLQVVTNSGAPGAATTIRIRGNSSIRSGNNPLFVVDGIPLDGRLARPGFSPLGLGVTPESNPLYFFNSADIAGMEVLKDASATAIYGSRGANGVIMITTKQGSSGAAKLDVSSSVAVSSIARKFDVLDAGGYRNALKAYNLTSGDLGGNADALSAILRSGVTQNYNVGISGGSENGKYRISLGYLGQQGIVDKTDMKRFTVNANGQYKFLKSRRLSLDFNVFAGQAKENIAPITNNAGFQGNLIGMALQWNPTQNLMNTNGTLNIIPGSTIVNPLAMQRGYTDISNISSLFAIAGLGYKIADGLDYRFNVSLNRQTGVRQSELKRYITIVGVEGLGQGYQGNTQMNTTVLQHTLSYNKDLTKKLNMNALLGYEYQDFKFSGAGTSAIGFANDDVPFYNILQNAPAANRAISSFEDPDASLQSYFGRIGFNYDDRFIISGTLRADGSSKFGANNKYGYFPSGSIAWNITNEQFLKNSSSIQNLRLRASYGLTGNQAFPAGSAQTQWAYAGNAGGLFQLNVANADLKWETTKQLNVGLDFSLAKGRVFGNIDYFNRVTSDILFAFAAIQPAPAVSVWKNIEDATITNSGLEVSLGANIIRKKDLNWNFTVNAAFLKNVFDNYSGPPILTGEINGQGLTGAFAQRIANGQPLNAFYTRNFLGLDKDGLGTYANAEAPEFVGDPNPSMLLGLSTDLNWKKLTLVVNMNGAFGHVLYNNTLNAVLPIGNLGTRNIATSLMSLTPLEARANPIKASSRYLEKGDFLRMANVSLSYNLGNVGKEIKNANIFVTAQNLFVLTKFSGFDPEVNTDKNIGGVPSFGIEYLPYPAARTIQAGFRFGL